VLTYCDSSALVVLLRPDEEIREPLVLWGARAKRFRELAEHVAAQP